MEPQSASADFGEMGDPHDGRGKPLLYTLAVLFGATGRREERPCETETDLRESGRNAGRTGRKRSFGKVDETCNRARRKRLFGVVDETHSVRRKRSLGRAEETHKRVRRKRLFGVVDETRGVQRKRFFGVVEETHSHMQRKRSFGRAEETCGSVRGRTVFAVCPYDEDITQEARKGGMRHRWPGKPESRTPKRPEPPIQLARNNHFGGRTKPGEVRASGSKGSCSLRVAFFVLCRFGYGEGQDAGDRYRRSRKLSDP